MSERDQGQPDPWDPIEVVGEIDADSEWLDEVVADIDEDQPDLADVLDVADCHPQVLGAMEPGLSTDEKIERMQEASQQLEKRSGEIGRAFARFTGSDQRDDERADQEGDE